MATTVYLAPPTILQFFDNSGRPAAGGSVLTQVGGVNYPTYQDSAGSTPLPNPIPLNSRGEISTAAGASAQLFLVAGQAYTFTLFDANGNQLNTANYVASEGASSALKTSLAAPSGSSLVGFLQAGTGAIARTAQDKMRDTISVKDFGAKGDGVTDDTNAIKAALAAVSAIGGGIVEMPFGQYVITSTISVPPYVLLRGQSWLPDPSNGAQVFATSIYVNFGAGMAVGSGNQAITLNHSSGIEGVTFYYPGQAAKTASTPVIYDWTISTPVGGSAIDNVYIRNVTLYNSYAGINASNGGRIRIENVQGDPLFTGLQMHGNFDVCYVDRIHFWNFYTQGAALETWVAANATGYSFGRVDDLQANDLFVWNVKTGFNFYGSDSGALWANIKGLTVDTAGVPINISAANQINITDFQLISSAATGPGIVITGGGNINFGQGQITSAASVGAEIGGASNATITFTGTNFNNQHSAVVNESSSGAVYLNGCTWNTPPFGQNNVFIDGQPLGYPDTNVAYPAITATGTVTGAGANWTFPLTSAGTSTIYFPFHDLNQRESIWTLQFNYNMPVLATTWYFQVLVQTDTGTFIQVAYSPTYPLVLSQGIGSGTPLVRIPIHAGYTQFITRVIIQVVTTAGTVGGQLNITNLALYEQNNQHTTDSQVSMFKNRGLYLDAYGMGQVLFSKGKNRRVVTQSQSGYKPSEVPTAGTWAVGDEVCTFNPAAGGFIGYVCTTAGTPGTWKSYGAISP